MSRSRRSLGARGEELAKQALQEAGLAIVDRNWRCPIGEIDIVAEEQAHDYVHGGTMAAWRVLVEVRTRRGERFGAARQSITLRKAAKLRQVGNAYIQASAWAGPWRIDLVAVQMDEQGHLQSIEHIRGAVTG
jgi:putative endonuclease